MFSAMHYASGQLSLIDQRLLPNEEINLECRDLETVAVAIETMAVRGAPAIGCAAAFALAIDAWRENDKLAWGDYQPRFLRGVERLRKTRPTAVNLFYALDRMTAYSRELVPQDSMANVTALFDRIAHQLFEDDVATCRAIGEHGADFFKGKTSLRVLTHCNAGALATAGYGTALGVIRSLAARNQIELVYADETRPWFQGARLTAFELRAEKIPYKVIADSTAAYLMQQKKIDFVVAGADRIAANGDTANKIGTYGLAVQCHYHGVPFFIAAPRTTFDLNIADGGGIPVEERSPDEVRQAGGKTLTPADAPVYNPSFDITPASLITGIVTEAGVLQAPFGPSIAKLFH